MAKGWSGMDLGDLDNYISGGHYRKGRQAIKCIAPQSPEPLEADEIGLGCGWSGVTISHTEYDATDWELNDCPDCGGPVGADE